MSLADLTKEQKQYLGLGGLGAVVLVVLAVMGIRFSLSSIAAAKLELADLTEKIERADKALIRQDQTSEDFDRTAAILKAHLENAPPKKNYYSWATEIVYSKGRDSGMQIQSVDEVVATGRAKKAEDGAGLNFEAYSLRVAARGDYEQIKEFILKVEEDHPLVRFTGLEISAGTDPGGHSIQLFLQWPSNLGDIEKRWEEVRAKQLKLGKRKTTKPAPVQPTKPVEGPPVIAAVKPAPKPAPKPEVKVVPEIKEPAPVIAIKPIPKPEPVIVAKSAPVVEKPAPKVAIVVPAPEPKPEPILVVEKPAPVVVVVPKPIVKPAPQPVVEKPVPVIAKVEPIVEPAPIPVVKKPAPIAIVVVPEPIVEPKKIVVVPEPKPVPVVVEPEPVVVAEVEPEPIPEPVVEPAPPVQEDSLGSLLASLNSRGDNPIVPEVVEPVESEDLETFLKQMQEPSVPVVEPEPQDPPKVVDVTPDPIVPPAADAPTRYVSSSKSANKLAELLTKEERKPNTSLSSFLDGLVEDINDKR